MIVKLLAPIRSLIEAHPHVSAGLVTIATLLGSLAPIIWGARVAINALVNIWQALEFVLGTVSALLAATNWEIVAITGGVLALIYIILKLTGQWENFKEGIKTGVADITSSIGNFVMPDINANVQTTTAAKTVSDPRVASNTDSMVNLLSTMERHLRKLSSNQPAPLAVAGAR